MWKLYQPDVTNTWLYDTRLYIPHEQGTRQHALDGHAAVRVIKSTGFGRIPSGGRELESIEALQYHACLCSGEPALSRSLVASRLLSEVFSLWTFDLALQYGGHQEHAQCSHASTEELPQPGCGVVLDRLHL